NCSYTYSGYDVEESQDATVLQLPVLLSPKVATGAGDIHFFLGPDIVFVLGDIEATMKFDDGSSLSAEITPDNALLFAATGGIGYSNSLGSIGTIGAEVRYTRVLSKLQDNFDSYMNGVEMYVTYGLPVAEW
ncbi:MAG: hypothetical protein K9L68_15195, partial [Spirochaetales bacterium]|nr:hypothetical protein [Spirochaetales bacterium]MCF7939938.1 hypothetical protein [Spirochaetales bacterium]